MPYPIAVSNAIDVAGPPHVPEPAAELYVVTAYTSGPESTGKRPGHPAYGITASGKRVKAGRTAVCPREMAFGTRINIRGVGERVCDDRGGAIKGKRIDVYIPDLKGAVEFGRQTLEVTVISTKIANRGVDRR
ncbi:3D domain-containing protein [Paenibacillus naphthalenovorans]|uniref:3D domain-containing protein n=1 Tax=Paenibacillus naphthalenovorans TaxID=162209 RepID=UPI003D2E6C74